MEGYNIERCRQNDLYLSAVPETVTLARQAGSMEKAEQLADWRESVVFTEAERAVLEYVEVMTLSDRRVRDEVQRMRKKECAKCAI